MYPVTLDRQIEEVVLKYVEMNNVKHKNVKDRFWILTYYNQTFLD